MPAGEQVWDLPAVRALAGEIAGHAEALEQSRGTLAGINISADDGAGGAVAEAIADFVSAADKALHARANRLAALADATADGVVTVREVDEANAEGVVGILRRLLPGGAEPRD